MAKKESEEIDLKCLLCGSRNVISTKTERVCRRCGNRTLIVEEKK